jgi:aspartate-semialdehyde dehydrogenase
LGFPACGAYRCLFRAANYQCRPRNSREKIAACWHNTDIHIFLGEAMLRVGFIGWRGMVGSVLMQRMREEKDFAGIEPVFFTTSNVGGAGPQEARGAYLLDALDLKELSACDVLISCQGGDYTSEVYPFLRKYPWKGYWIDAASTLRMSAESIIILDPVNGGIIQDGLQKGLRCYVGGNCTVSLMLMSTAALFEAGLVEWMTTMTYQAASGAGAAKMLELVQQMRCLTDPSAKSPSENALEVDRMVIEAQRSAALPTAEFGVPLAGSLIPWIDKEMPEGQTREEWKGMAETNKIMGLNPPVPVDGICVRVGTMRCHSQGLCVKLTKDVPLAELEQLLAAGNQWVRVVPNNKDASIRCLTPTAVSGTLTVPIGRLHKLKLGPQYLGGFTVGDQLLWGAAEPLRRMLNLLRAHVNA